MSGAMGQNWESPRPANLQEVKCIRPHIYEFVGTSIATTIIITLRYTLASSFPADLMAALAPLVTLGLIYIMGYCAYAIDYRNSEKKKIASERKFELFLQNVNITEEEKESVRAVYASYHMSTLRAHLARFEETESSSDSSSK